MSQTTYRIPFRWPVTAATITPTAYGPAWSAGPAGTFSVTPKGSGSYWYELLVTMDASAQAEMYLTDGTGNEWATWVPLPVDVREVGGLGPVVPTLIVPVTFTPVNLQSNSTVQVFTGPTQTILQGSAAILAGTAVDGQTPPQLIPLTGKTVRANFYLSPNAVAFAHDNAALGGLTLSGTTNSTVTIQLTTANTSQAQTWTCSVWNVTDDQPVGKFQLVIAPDSGPGGVTTYTVNQSGGTGAGSAPMTSNGVTITTDQFLVEAPPGNPVAGAVISAYAASDTAFANVLGTQVTTDDGRWQAGIALASGLYTIVVSGPAGFQVASFPVAIP